MKKTLITILITSFLVVTASISYAQNISRNEDNSLDDLTILVPSCDKYSVLWDPFFKLLFQNWPSLNTYNKNINILLVSNNKTYKHSRVKSLQIKKERSWSDNMLEALENVDTKYVMIILEDYIINSPVDDKLLAKLYSFMRKNNGGYVAMAALNPETQYGVNTKLTKLVQLSKHCEYRTALQIGVWDKKMLQWLLKSGESAWLFETIGSKRSEGTMQPFFAYADSSTQPIKHLNAAYMGMLRSEVINYIRSQGIDIDLKNQPLPLDSNRKLYRFKQKVMLGSYNNIIRPIMLFCKKAFLYLLG